MSWISKSCSPEFLKLMQFFLPSSTELASLKCTSIHWNPCSGWQSLVTEFNISHQEYLEMMRIFGQKKILIILDSKCKIACGSYPCLSKYQFQLKLFLNCKYQIVKYLKVLLWSNFNLFISIVEFEVCFCLCLCLKSQITDKTADLYQLRAFMSI